MSAEELLHFGAIYVNKKRVRNNILLAEGDYLRIHHQPKRYPINWNYEDLIAFQNDDFLCAIKPYGIPCTASLDNYTENLSYQLEQRLNTKLFAIHRLDLNTTGLIIMAKNNKTAGLLGKLMEKRKIHKTYRALSRKKTEPGLFTHYMKKTDSMPKELSITKNDAFSLECKLEITDRKNVLEEKSFLSDSQLYPATELSSEHLYEYKINLLTGRTHQIRAQLNALGACIFGDTTYTDKSENKRPSLFALQSCCIWFKFRGEDFFFSI